MTNDASDSGAGTTGIDFMGFILSVNLRNKEIFANFTIIYKIERVFKEVQIP